MTYPDRGADETLKDMRRRSLGVLHIFSTQDHAARERILRPAPPVFSWNGESLEELLGDANPDALTFTLADGPTLTGPELLWTPCLLGVHHFC